MDQVAGNPYYHNNARPGLVPEGGSDDEGVYQLTDSTVNPTRVIGRDHLGMPIEDTIPAAYWKPFVHPCGAINKVPLRTGAVFSRAPHHEQYELREMRDKLSKGWIPLWVCPYTEEFRAFTGGPIVTPPPGEKDCGGHPQGCVHLQEVMRARTKASRERHDAEVKKMTEQSDEERKKLVADIIAGVAGGVGSVLADRLPDATDLRAARRRAMVAEDADPLAAAVTTAIESPTPTPTPKAPKKDS